MSDLIDREAAVEVAEAFLHVVVPEKDSDEMDRTARYSNGTVQRIVAAIRSLPAAVPVVDVEKAAETYRAGRVISRGSTDEEKVAAILSAGYAGAVSVADVRDVARFVGIIARCIDRGEKITFSDLGEIGPAAKRLLAAAEVKP